MSEGGGEGERGEGRRGGEGRGDIGSLIVSSERARKKGSRMERWK